MLELGRKLGPDYGQESKDSERMESKIEKEENQLWALK